MENTATPLDRLFDNRTETLNGDEAFKSTNSNLIDILFQSQWLKTHTEEINIGQTPKEKLFAMFMRDCRYGMGCKNVGRRLLKLTGATFEEILLCGRGDDIWRIFSEDEITSKEMADWLYNEIKNDNQLVKKWMPRFPTHNKTAVVKEQHFEMNAGPAQNKLSDMPGADKLAAISGIAIEDDQSSGKPIYKKNAFTEHQLERLRAAKKFAGMWGMNRQQYKRFVKVNTVENMLSRHHWDEVQFEHVPSLAHLKYAHTFFTKDVFASRYKKYLEDVKAGKKKINTGVATVYDIYKARRTEGFDPDMWFDRLENIDISAAVVMDTSGSMCRNDAIGKALSVCYYLSMNSSYCKGQFVTFSCSPQLVTLQGDTFNERIDTIDRSGWENNTDLGAVARMLQNLEGALPDWLIIVSDMQFDSGSTQSMHELMQLWHHNGWKTKIVWWNLAENNATAPETVEGGNIFMSGLSPMLLKYLSVGFNAERFLDELLYGYQKNIKREYITDERKEDGIIQV